MNEPPPVEVLQYLRAPALPGAEILIADSSLHSWRMLHQRYLICGCQWVSTSWIYRRKTRQIEDGLTAFMEPGEIHQVVEKRKPSHFRAMFIEPGDFLDFAAESDIPGIPHFAKTEVSSASLLHNLHALAECLRHGKSDLELQSLLAVIVNEALQHAETRPKVVHPEGPGLARSLQIARDLLQARYNENVTLGELATAAALSRFHLVRSFTARYGLPPHAYQIQLRVKRACQLLRAGVSCAEVASTVGFADQSHFARHFRKVMRVTPRAYMRSL